MENQELLNPESDKNKKENGVENLNPEQESQNQTEIENPTHQNPSAESDKTDSKQSVKEDSNLEEQTEATATTDAQDSESEPGSKVTPDSTPDKVSTTVDEVKPDAEEVHPKEIKESADIEEEKEVVASEDKADVEKEVVAHEDNAEVDKAETAPMVEGKKEEQSEITEPVKTEADKATPTKNQDEIADESESSDTDEDGDEEDDLTAKYQSMDKEALVEAIEVLVKHDDIGYIRKHIGYIKVAFRNYLKEHSVSEYETSINKTDDAESNNQEEKPVDEHVVRFDKAFAIYREKKVVFDQAVETQKQDNLQTKERILEELRSLIESEEELKKTYDVFKELQEKWRQLGPVPQGAKNTLWNNYHFLVEKFFDKVKINKELRDLDLRKNLEIKTELCEKAEELLLESSISKSFQKLQKLHDAWKESGPVPKDKKDEIWDRFKAASDTLNERRQSYYDSLREEQSKNLAAKILLCEQAEELVSFTSDSPKKWQDATDKVNELFKVWKTVGFAPKKINDEVWVRFRSALDAFFNHKKEFFFKYKDDQTENYNQKLNLCMQAEALKDSEDWKQTTDELITLQKQWKKIGPVPKKFSDKVWKRFRVACDEFFNRKAEYFSNIGEKQDENLRLKKELIEMVKTYPYSKDNNENLNVLKDFQRQWMEIGHVPIKEKDKIQNEFRKVVNDLFDSLNISRKVKTTIGFKNKIENLKNSPNADNVIYKEKTYLFNKISAIQNDIKLWENNIGFFASSKKADVLKSEFEQKIERAKADISILEEKLKILNAS